MEPPPSDSRTARFNRPLCVLSIDGGGIRGIIPLLVLRQIMAHIRVLSDGRVVKPCQVFHIIGGTSAGGLIALMLGRLEMTVDGCINAFEDLSKGIFRTNPVRSSRFFFSKTHWYDAKGLESTLKTVIRENTGDDEALMQPNTDHSSRAFVVAVIADDITNPTPTLFRTYPSPSPVLDNGPDCRSTPIWKAGRATSAAPTYFEPLRLDGQQYVDGGFGHNNPAFSVAREAGHLTTAPRPIECMVSLGTGVPGTVAFKIYGNLITVWTRLPKVSKSMQAIVTDTEKTRRNMKDAATRSNFTYFRFNPVLSSLDKFPLDAWQKIDALKAEIEGATGYISQEDHMIRRCAGVLNRLGLHVPDNDWNCYNLVPSNLRDNVQRDSPHHIPQAQGASLVGTGSLDLAYIPDILAAVMRHSTGAALSHLAITPDAVTLHFASTSSREQEGAQVDREEEEEETLASGPIEEQPLALGPIEERPGSVLHTRV